PRTASRGWTAPGTAKPPGSGPPGGRDMCGSRAHRRLLRRENAVDDLLDRWVLDRDIREAAPEIVHEPPGPLGRDLPVNSEGYSALLPRNHGAVSVEVGRRRGPVVERRRDDLVRGHALGEIGERSVVEEAAAVDDDHALAERDNVIHVVAREQDGRASPTVVLRNETADAHLHRDVEPDRRLVQKCDARRVDEARSELDLHALAEGEVAHGLVNELLQLEELGKLVHGRSELSLRDPVDLLKNTEAIGGGDVPHEL